MADPSIPAKYAVLREQITTGLRETLGKASAPDDLSGLLSQFRQQAQDYQTLILMDVLPNFAVAALSAYQSVDKAATDGEARQWLLTLMRDSYYAAVESGPIEADNQHQH